MKGNVWKFTEQYSLYRHAMIYLLGMQWITKNEIMLIRMDGYKVNFCEHLIPLYQYTDLGDLFQP